MAKPTIAQAASAADAFLELKAKQAELAEQEAKLKKVFLAFGRDVIEGRIARVTVSKCEGRESVDMEALKRILTPARIAAIMKRGAPSTRFMAKQRLADASVAA